MSALDLFDSHVHLADPRLERYLERIASDYDSIGLSRAVVVGTSPDDWERVVQLCESDSRYLPAIGLHPWKVNTAPEDWREGFLRYVESGVAIIGEIGLDQWIEGHDIEQQVDAFRFQFSIAAERNLPTSIHCLKAHEPLLQTLCSCEIPGRGFKLHAYNGPADTIPKLLELGAYFSFNAGQLRPNAKRIREIITSIPIDRLLIETDAPDFLPSEQYKPEKLEGNETPHNHPENITLGYEATALLVAESQSQFAQKVAENFRRYFT